MPARKAVDPDNYDQKAYTGRYWIFVENNHEGLVDFAELPPLVTFMVYQEEVGEENGTSHLQGYLELSEPRRLAWLKNNVNPRAHFKPRGGSQQQIVDYCTKLETRVSGPYTFGKPSSSCQGARTDLTAVKQLLDLGTPMVQVAEQQFSSWVKYHRAFDLYQQMHRPTKRPEQVVVEVHYGPSGVGKTMHAYTRFPDLFVKTDKSPWWDQYEGHSVILLDDFNGWIPHHELLHLCDHYPYRVQVKGGHRNIVASTVLITTNYLPHLWYKKDLYWPAIERRVTQWTLWTSLGKMTHYKTYGEFQNGTTQQILPPLPGTPEVVCSSPPWPEPTSDDD